MSHTPKRAKARKREAHPLDFDCSKFSIGEADALGGLRLAVQWLTDIQREHVREQLQAFTADLHAGKVKTRGRP